MAVFFERFRVELRKYQGGVHDVGAPADRQELLRTEARLGRELPRGLREMYRSWNGLRLFLESIELVPLAELRRAEQLFRLGQAPEGELWVDGEGRLFCQDDDGDRVLAGTAIDLYLAAVMLREGQLIDAAGEWRDVFDDEEEEGLSAPVRRRRSRVALKADPGAAGWRIEAAELALDEGDLLAAKAELERAVAADPEAAPAHALLAALAERDGRRADAERAWERAAMGSRGAGRRAERRAEAARLAAADGARAAHARAALDDDPELSTRYRAQAESLLEEGDVEGALRRAELAASLAPGPEADALTKRARLRRSLPRL